MGLFEFIGDMFADDKTFSSRLAQRALKIGDYESAAHHYQKAEMYKEAGDAFMCSVQQGNTYYLEHAAEAYAKGRCNDHALSAYMKVFQEGHLRKEYVEQIKSLNLWNRFCDKVVENIPPCPSNFAIESVEDSSFAIKCYLRIAEKTDNKKQAFEATDEAICCAQRAGFPESEILDFCIIALKRDPSDLFAWGKGIIWLEKKDLLRDFIEKSYQEAPGILWRALYEYSLRKGWDKITGERGNVIACGMLRCVKHALQKGGEIEQRLYKRAGGAAVLRNTAERLEGVELYMEAAEIYATADGHSAKAAECYKKANQSLKAAEVLEQLGEFKEAAGLAEDAGNKKLAIRLYEQALKKDGISDTEAEWIKTTLKRLRKGDGPSTNEAKSPVTTPGKPKRDPPQQESVRTCPQCGNQISKENSFCSDCGYRLGSTCSKCGTEVPVGKKFCTECGRKIE